MDSGDVKALKEGSFMDLMEVGIEVNGVKVMLHILHQIRRHIQGSKHHKNLQDKMSLCKTPQPVKWPLQDCTLL
jgi:hypothetical protein